MKDFISASERKSLGLDIWNVIETGALLLVVGLLIFYSLILLTN